MSGSEYKDELSRSIPIASLTVGTGAGAHVAETSTNKLLKSRVAKAVAPAIIGAGAYAAGKKVTGEKLDKKSKVMISSGATGAITAGVYEAAKHGKNINMLKRGGVLALGSVAGGLVATNLIDKKKKQ